MVKKNSIIIFILLVFTSTIVFAGDIPESIMKGKQKALFIGRITAINTDTFSIIPSTIMMGSIQQSEVRIKKFDRYYGADNKPKTGDIIVAVLLEDNRIDDLWVFKCTTEDYKTLKLDTENNEKYDMVGRYQQYINEGKYFEAQKKIDESKKISITPTVVNVESKEIVEDNKIQSYLNNKQFVVTLLLVATVIVVLFKVRFKKRHNN